MKKLIYISILIIIGATLFNETYAQKTNPAMIENVPESYAWDIVYQSFKKHNKKLYNYNKQTQTAKSIFYRYTSMLVDNRAKYQVTYKNGNIEIKFVDRQYLAKDKWVDNLLPLSKKTKKKYIYPIAETIRELNEKTLSNTPPVAVFLVYPTSGGTSIDFKFNALASHDNQDPSSTLEVRWDWQNDGIWDKQWSTDKIIEHSYSNEGQFTIKMEVKDSQGITHQSTRQLIVKNYPPCPNQPLVWYMEHLYNTVLIGDQCWLKENLNVGTMIEVYQPMSDNDIIEKYCYDNDSINCTIYGGLYQWNELMQYNKENYTGICPEGWRIPTEDDFGNLINNLGGWAESGDKLKEAGLFHWPPPEGIHTNESGFTALSGGISEEDGTFNQLNLSAYFASKKHKESPEEFLVSVFNPDNNQTKEITYKKDTAWNLVLTGGNAYAEYNKISMHNGVSVRCMKSYKTPPVTKKRKKGYPNACFIVDPPFGTTETIFKFNGDCSSDKKDPTSKLKVRWNWTYSKYDRWYDTYWNRNKEEEYQFKVPGCYNVRMEVKDTDRLRDYTIVTVCVYPPNTFPAGAYPPWACFEVEPERGALRDTFEFDARCSYDIEDPDSVLRFCWDWNNDWKWDTDTSSKNILKYLKFNKEGIDTVGMEVFDTDDLSNITTREVYVGFPTACFTVEPDIGTTDIFFRFDANCSFDTEDPPSALRIKWDFQNDGKYETDWLTKRKIGYKYFQPGVYTVKLLVMDTKGLQDSCYLDVYVESPIACFEVIPGMGKLTTVFRFNATCSYDKSSPDTQLEVRWDWNNDGIYETEWNINKFAEHQYDKEGFKTIRLQVRTEAGNTDYTTLSIYVMENICPTIHWIKPHLNVKSGHLYNISFVAKIDDIDNRYDYLRVHWDFTNDGIVDRKEVIYGYGNFPKQTIFSDQCKFEYKLEVIDIEGCTSTRTGIVDVCNGTSGEPGTKYTPPVTNCPKKEYLLYFPFTNDADEFKYLLNKISAQGYKLKLGSFALCFFEREENNSTIYPVKVLKRTDIEEINELAKSNWVLVNDVFYTYLIKEKAPPLYEYKSCENISYRDLQEYKNYLPGGENIELFNDYGKNGWELVYFGGEKPLFRRIKGSTVKYKYMSFILQSKDLKVLQELGKKGWQYCAYPNSLRGKTGQTPVILKQRVGMGDAFSFEAIVTEKPNPEGLSYIEIEGDPEEEKQWKKSFEHWSLDLNNYGRAGWTFEMLIEANEYYFGKNKMIMVFQVPADCR